MSALAAAPAAWALFAVVILGLLALDLLVFNRQAHAVSIQEAAAWSAVWIGLGLLFNGYVYWARGPADALAFLTAYLVEKSLSVDNIFVFLAIFGYFRIAPRHQHRVLFWGVMGALILRFLFIAAGAALLERFHWMIWLFGALLIVTAVRLAMDRPTETDPSQNLVLRLTRRFLRMTDRLDGQRFFLREDGRWRATPLFVALIVIEFSDVAFAFDSVPAALGVSRDVFIVYASNVFAILGLRALYFVVAGAVARLRFLHVGLALILGFIGAKMLLGSWIDLPTWVSLLVVASVLAATAAVSLLAPARPNQPRA